MIVEGRVESIGVDKNGKKYATINVRDLRYKEATDTIYVSDEGFIPGEYVDISISTRTT